MLKSHRIAALSILLTLSLILSGCGSSTSQPTPTPAIVKGGPPDVNIRMNPDATEVQVNAEVAISAETTGSNLQIKWSAAKGKLSRTEGQSVIYTAPSTPGLDTVDVTVISGEESTVKSIAFTVIAATVAEVPTPPPSPTEPVASPTIETGPVTLTTLQDSQTVPCENLARGTYSPDVIGHIWPVVYIAGRFHPQDEGGKAPSMVNGTWYGTVRFGNCNAAPTVDRGKVFQLIIVVADEQANKEFVDYLDSAKQAESWPGLETLPEGAPEYIRILVTRK